MSAGRASGVAEPEPGQPDIAGSMREAERVLPRVVRTDEEVLPTRAPLAEPTRPGLTGGADWIDPESAPARLPEGSFVIDRPGRIVPAPGGRRVFVPDTGARQPGEGPMLLLPCAALERLEVTLNESDPPVVASGQVFVYHDRRALLLTSFRIGIVPNATPTEPTAEPAPEPIPDATSEPGASAATPTPESKANDPEVDALLAELGEEAGGEPGADRHGSPGVTGAGDDAAGVDSTPGLRDGTPIVRQRGRLTRSGEGVWMFVVDNDPDSGAYDAPMPLLPCLLLERVEREAQTRGDAAQIVLSGRTHAYRGTVYLLPTSMARVRVSDIVPTQ